MLQPKDISFFAEQLPFWEAMTPKQQKDLTDGSRLMHAAAGELVHRGEEECLGVLLVHTGRLRAYMLSASGREITLYFIEKQSLTMLSATCILRNAAMPVYLDAEEDCEFFVIPPTVYNALRCANPEVEHFTSEVLGASFSRTLASMEQVLFLSVEQRLALYLLERSAFEESDEVHITHEAAARQLGTAREVVSRTLKQFAQNGWIESSRKGILLKEKNALKALSEER